VCVLIILFYGLIVLYKPCLQRHTSLFLCFVGILMTGVFMLNYGQFVPAWDSNYYGMMITKYPMKQYLNSKAVLMSVSVLILAVLSTLSLFWVENPSHKSSLQLIIWVSIFLSYYLQVRITKELI
jgi:hypothetical protein